MTIQEQAFEIYYSSMTDAQLLTMVANRSSFIEVAQKSMVEELARRNLQPQTDAAPGAPIPSERSGLRPFTRMAHAVRKLVGR